MRRRTSLRSNPEHEWSEEPGENGWHVCSRCGKRTRRPGEDTSWCSGLKRTSSLGSGAHAHENDPEVYGPYHQWISSEDCLLGDRTGHRCAGGVVGHHVRSVGAGGKDVGNEVPLCDRAHREVHRIGRESFEERYSLDLWREAARFARQAPKEARPDAASAPVERTLTTDTEGQE